MLTLIVLMLFEGRLRPDMLPRADEGGSNMDDYICFGDIGIAYRQVAVRVLVLFQQPLCCIPDQELNIFDCAHT